MCIFILKETSSFQSSNDSSDILRLKEEISVLKEERNALQRELSTSSTNQKVKLQTAMLNFMHTTLN